MLACGLRGERTPAAPREPSGGPPPARVLSECALVSTRRHSGHPVSGLLLHSRDIVQCAIYTSSVVTKLRHRDKSMYCNAVKRRVDNALSSQYFIVLNRTNTTYT